MFCILGQATRETELWRISNLLAGRGRTLEDARADAQLLGYLENAVLAGS
jgi:hypothetical protein